jgi:hypothetical protein
MTFYRQAAAICVALGDQRYEGFARHNAAKTLVKLRRYDEARAQNLRTIECDKPFGHAAEPWKTWSILRRIENARGDEVAAREAWRQAQDSYLTYRREGGMRGTQAGSSARSSARSSRSASSTRPGRPWPKEAGRPIRRPGCRRYCPFCRPFWTAPATLPWPTTPPWTTTTRRR